MIILLFLMKKYEFYPLLIFKKYRFMLAIMIKVCLFTILTFSVVIYFSINDDIFGSIFARQPVKNAHHAQTNTT